MNDMTLKEAGGRVLLAADTFQAWPTEELWDEFVLLTDDSWEHGGNEPLPEPWAKREAVGLALIGRGVTAAELQRGYPVS